MKKTSCLAAVLTAFFCGGCWFMQAPVNRPSETYDLAPAQPVNKQLCQFARIRNLSPAGRKMLYRHPDNRMTEGPASWVQPPETLLQRALESRFQAGTAAPEITVSLLRFDLDLAAKQAVLTAELTLPAKKTEYRGDFTAPLTDNSGAAASRAMSECVEKLANLIITMIQEK